MSDPSSDDPGNREMNAIRQLPGRGESVDPGAFEAEANTPNPGIFREFYDFLIEYRVWWLTPIVLVLLLLAGLVFLSGTAVAPLIYPLF